MSKFESLLTDFSRAITQLAKALQQEKNEYLRDSCIQRFEFTFDLAWKTTKAFMEEQKGVISRSPKDVFREAYKQGMLEYDTTWLDLTDLRNETVHTYREDMAERVYGQLQQ